MPSVDTTWYSVADYPTIQAAVDDATSHGGGTVYFPPGLWQLREPLLISSQPNGAIPSAPLILLGDGPNASRVTSTQSNPIFDLLHIQRNYVTVEGLAFDGRATAAGAPRGIVIGEGPTDTHHVTIRDCIVRNTASYGLEIAFNSSAGTIASDGLYERCVFSKNFSKALTRVGEQCARHDFSNCSWDFFVGSAVQLFSCSRVTISGSDLETPQDVGTAPYLVARDAVNCGLLNCWFEEPTTVTSTQWFVDLGKGCHGFVILSPRFQRKLYFPGNALMLIRVGDDTPVTGGPCIGVVIVNPYVLIPNIAQAPPIGHITIRNSSSEYTLIGGTLMTVNKTRYPIEVLDPTTKSSWIGHRRWRLPQVGTAENAPSASLHLGDLLCRPGRGLEAWNAYAPRPSWIPLTENRYANQTTLNALPASSINLGSLAWVDSESVLKVCTSVGPPPTWRVVAVATETEKGPDHASLSASSAFDSGSCISRGPESVLGFLRDRRLRSKNLCMRHKRRL